MCDEVPPDCGGPIKSLPFALLEENGRLCSTAAAASARGTCRLWRAAFNWQHHLRLYSQRLASDAGRLASAPQTLFPRATCATLVLSTSTAACSQAQLDAWLDALRQRTAITQLTLTSSSAAPLSAVHHSPPPQPHLDAFQAGLSRLQHLRTLELLPTLSINYVAAAAAAVGVLPQLTRLRATLGRAPASALNQSLSRAGASRLLSVVDVSFEGYNGPGAACEADLDALLRAFAVAAPRLLTLSCRHLSTTHNAMRVVDRAFSPAVTRGMSMLCSNGASSADLLWTLRKPAGSGATTATLLVALGPTAAGPALDLCTLGVERAARSLKELLAPGGTAVLEDLTLVVSRKARDVATLDMGALPASLHTLGLYLGDGPRAWPAITGRAAALLSLLVKNKTHGAEPVPLPVLARGCPNLRSLTVACHLQCGTGAPWAALTLLRQLTYLRAEGGSCGVPDAPASHPMQAFPADGLPPALRVLELQHLRLLAAPRRPALPHLRTLELSHCVVADFEVFGEAGSLHTVARCQSYVESGAEALLLLSELEHLADVYHHMLALPVPAAAQPPPPQPQPQPPPLSAAPPPPLLPPPPTSRRCGLLVSVACAMWLGHLGPGAMRRGHALPRLRRLEISATDLARDPDALALLLQGLSLQELHISTSPKEGADQDATGGAALWAAEEKLTPVLLGLLRRPAVLQVSGRHAQAAEAALQAAAPPVLAVVVVGEDAS